MVNRLVCWLILATTLAVLSPAVYAQTFVEVYSTIEIEQNSIYSECGTVMESYYTWPAYPQGVSAGCSIATPSGSYVHPNNPAFSSGGRFAYSYWHFPSKLPNSQYYTQGYHDIWFIGPYHDYLGSYYDDPFGYGDPSGGWYGDCSSHLYVGADYFFSPSLVDKPTYACRGWGLGITDSNTVTTNGIFPSSVYLIAGQPQTFTANEWSNWTVTAGAVAPSPNNQVIYTHPDPVTSAETVALSAINVNNSADQATASIYLNPASITISPASASLVAVPGTQIQYYYSTTGTSLVPTRWVVSGLGTITTTGLYQAASPAPTTQQSATIEADIYAVKGTATLTLLPPVGISALTPTTWNSGGQTSITIKGDGFGSSPQIRFSDPNVIWTPGSASCSTGSSPTCTIQGTVQIPPYRASESLGVTVINPAYGGAPGYSAASWVTVNAATLSVSVSPTSVTLQAAQQQQFAATVTCKTAGNVSCYPPVVQTVNWSVAGIGSIATNGLYTAPTGSSVTNTTPADTVSACSTATSPQVCATATVKFSPVTVAVIPASAMLYAGQTQQFSAQVGNTSNKGVMWSVTCASSCPNGVGSVDQSGLYSAPLPITSLGQSVTIKSCSQLDPSKCGNAMVSLAYVAPPSIGLSTPWSPVQVKTYNDNPSAVPYGPVGAPVTISGTNFVSQPTVTFRARESGTRVNATVGSWTPVSISVSVPENAVTGSVVVTVGGQASNAASFMVTNGTYNSQSCP